MADFPYRRMIVIGTTGSGKSTLAERLAKRLDVDFIELDALNWGPNWTPAGDELLRAKAEAATRSPGWVIAGNYSSTRPVTWPRAEAVIWLDYRFRTVLWRLARRTFLRWWRQEKLWNGNVEPLWQHFKLWSEESLFHWLVKTYWRRKREIPQLLQKPEHKHLQLIHLTDPAQTDEWLASINPAGAGH